MTKLNPRLVLALMFSAMLALGLLFRGCDDDPVPDVRDDGRAVRALVERLRADSIRMARVIDSMDAANATLREAKRTAEARERGARNDLRNTSANLASLRREYDAARADRDTSTALDRCDEMARHIGLLSGNVAALLSAVDSVNRVNDEIIENRDRVVAAQDSAIRTLRAGFADVSGRYGALEKTYTTLAKKHKRERRNKIIGIAAAVAAGVLFKIATK